MLSDWIMGDDFLEEEEEGEEEEKEMMRSRNPRGIQRALCSGHLHMIPSVVVPLL